eukprot:358811-Chlamydomonas_euryale.AAC.24
MQADKLLSFVCMCFPCGHLDVHAGSQPPRAKPTPAELPSHSSPHAPPTTPSCGQLASTQTAGRPRTLPNDCTRSGSAGWAHAATAAVTPRLRCGPCRRASRPPGRRQSAAGPRARSCHQSLRTRRRRCARRQPCAAPALQPRCAAEARAGQPRRHWSRTSQCRFCTAPQTAACCTAAVQGRTHPALSRNVTELVTPGLCRAACVRCVDTEAAGRLEMRRRPSRSIPAEAMDAHNSECCAAGVA